MIEEALMNYDFKHPESVFMRHNENMTYAVMDDNKKYLLRIHKAAEGLNFSIHCGETPRHVFIESESELLRKMYYDENLKVQCPIKNKLGEYITQLKSGDLVTVLSWIDGEDLTKTSITEELAYKIGQMIGNLHSKTSKISRLNRYSYDDELVERILKEIHKAYEMKHMEEWHYKVIEKTLICIKKILFDEKKNFIIVHADLSKSNLIYDNEYIYPIDFSLSGYCLPEMDLAGMVCSLNDKKLTPSLFKGYQSVSGYWVNEFYISAFTALSVILYIVSHHEKVFEDDWYVKAMDRWCNTIFNPVIM